MIAQQYGGNPVTLVMANGIDNANVIYVGIAAHSVNWYANAGGVL